MLESYESKAIQIAIGGETFILLPQWKRNLRKLHTMGRKHILPIHLDAIVFNYIAKYFMHEIKRYTKN